MLWYIHIYVQNVCYKHDEIMRLSLKLSLSKQMCYGMYIHIYVQNVCYKHDEVMSMFHPPEPPPGPPDHHSRGQRGENHGS